MSEEQTELEPILVALEQRVILAVTRLRELTAENRRLKSGVSPAVDGHAAPSHPGGATAAAYEARIAELDRERLGLLADRRALTQRVEEILARLEYLESETVSN